MESKKKIDISMGAEALLENGFFYLEEKQWKLSKEYFEKVIEINPRNSKAYLGLLLVANKLPTPDSLPNSAKPFDNSNNFKYALRYGDEEFALQLKTYADLYNKKREKEYQDACEKLSKSQTRKDYEYCYKIFCKLEKYKDCDTKAEKAKEFIDVFEYEDCIAKINDNLTEEACLELSNTLSKINYKDSKSLAEKYRLLYESLKEARKENEKKEDIYRSACSSYNSASSIKDILSVKESFESILNYKDSKMWAQKCQNKLDSRKTAFSLYKIWNNNKLLTGISCVLLVLFGFVFSNSLTTYIISMVICLGCGLFMGWITSDKKSVILEGHYL